MPIIRQQTQVFNKPIGVSRFDTGADEVYQAVSNFSDTVGRIAFQEGSRVAEERGKEKAQSLTPDQVTELSKRKEVIRGVQTIEQEAFNQSLDRRFVNQISNDIQLESKRIAMDYPDPVSYEQQFGRYLNDLSEGTNDRFKGVVSEVAKYEMADTKLDLVSKARTEARNDQAFNIGMQVDDAAEKANVSGIDGNDIAVLNLINEAGKTAKEGLDADLPLKRGADSAAINSVAISGISGVLENMLKNISSPTEQAGILVYLSTQGKDRDFLSKATIKRLDRFVPYLNTETIPQLLTKATAINSRYNSIRVIDAAKTADSIATQERRNQVNFPDDVDSKKQTSSVIAYNAFENSPDYQSAITQYSLLENNFLTDEKIENEKYVSGKTKTESEKDENIQDLRRARLDSLIITAAQDENIESLQSYIVSGNPNDLRQLTERQATIFSFLRSSSLYNSDEDRDHVQGLLEDVKNNFRKKIDANIRNVQLHVGVSNLIDNLNNSIIDSEQIRKTQEELALALKRNDINDTQFNNYGESLGAARSKGLANILSSQASSDELNALALFVQTNGKEARNLPDTIRTVGEAINNTITDSKRNEIVSHINSVREKISSKEAKAKEAMEEARLELTLFSGDAPRNTKTLNASDNLLKKNGVNLLSPSSKNQEIYKYLTGAMSGDLVNGLTTIYNGTSSPQTADLLLDHFIALRESPTDIGKVNAFRGYLSAEIMGVLDDVAEIRSNVGGNAAEIATQLVSLRDDEQLNVRVKSELGDKTPKQYLLEYFTKRPDLASEYDSVFEYYLRRGNSLDQARTKIDRLYNLTHTSDNHVVNMRFPSDNQPKNRFSIRLTIPDEEVRNEFIKNIETSLPEGYALIPTIGDNSIKKVYLVPDEDAQGYGYFTYVLDESGQWDALIVEEDGELVWPYYDTDTIKDFALERGKQKQIELKNALDKEEKKQQKLQDLTLEGFIQNRERIISDALIK